MQCHLSGMTKEETAAYIRHHLKVVGMDRIDRRLRNNSPTALISCDSSFRQCCRCRSLYHRITMYKDEKNDHSRDQRIKRLIGGFHFACLRLLCFRHVIFDSFRKRPTIAAGWQTSAHPNGVCWSHTRGNRRDTAR